MREQQISFESGSLRLAGTLCSEPTRTHQPAVLLLPGSGPLDRDGNHRRLRLDVSRQVAQALADVGVASLRFDKRGVGASPGDWRAAGLSDNIADAEAALCWLLQHEDVDRSSVSVVGHSEGAVIATALAARHPELAGVVLLGGTSRRGEEVLLWQAARITPTLPPPVRALLRLLRVDPVAQTAASHAKVKATTTDVARMNGVRMNARWFREYMAYDPSEDLARINASVLAITGSKDLQVDPDDLRRIAAAAAGPVSTHVVDDVTHTLRRQPSTPSLRRYRDEVKRPLDAELLTLIVTWLVSRTDTQADLHR